MNPPNHAELEDLLQSGYRYALALTGRRESAEDVLHEACLSLARTDGPWKRPLLFRAIKHRFIDACRRDQRRPPEVFAEEPESVAGDPRTSPRTHPRANPRNTLGNDGVLAKLVQEDAVEVALRCLSESEREAALLAWVEGYTARETARHLGRPRGTVLSLLHRAKQKLRERLADPKPAAPGQRKDGAS